jgi:zinc protease
MINRTLPPDIHTNTSVQLIEPQQFVLSNDSKIIQFPYTEQEVLKLSISFPGGKWFQNHPAVAQLTSQMLLEGTKSRNNKQIADAFEYYGAFVMTDSGNYNSSITVFCLQKHLPNIVPLLQDILIYSNFPQKQLDVILHNKKQHLAVNLEKISFVAEREFFKTIFPENYPYAIQVEKEHYDAIDRQMLHSFYKSNYNLQRSTIALVGNTDKSGIDLLENYFGEFKTKDQPSLHFFQLREQQAKQIYIEKKDVKQSVIILGKLFPNLTHHDYHKLRILNTILGGYFGSRLMKNIREKKGYTYGIHSSINSLVQTGVFSISSQVKAEFTSATISEINNEIKRLQENLVSQKELQLVKNYMLGQILRTCDGPFQQASFYLNTILYNIHPQLHIESAVRAIADTTREEIRALAQVYLNTDELHQVVVGKM